ncbi:hypothetical protein A235_06080, partial [Pseudomonas syringae pv. actinidiae ICMP 19079]
MRSDERIDIGQIVDARSVFQIRRARVLVPVAKAHQGFMGPGIVVEHRDLDDAGLQRALGDRTGL